MKKIATISIACVVTAIVMACAGNGTVWAGRPVGPHQHFVGLVNGSNRAPIVKVACPGPVQKGGVGAVVGGQTVTATEARKGRGYTGPFSQVYAWFAPAGGTPAPTELTISTYGTRVGIPSTILVPCGGSGQVVFSSCPYLAPCAYGWVPYTVKVEFQNIAV
jgi:hypothetical protein